jgi:hypothetical protein
MRTLTAGRTIALIAAICLTAVAISCVGVGLAVHQRVIEPPEVDVKFGAFHILTMGSHDVMCLAGPDTATNPCYRYKSTYYPQTYRIWLFASANEQGAQRPKVLLRLSVPLRASRE